MVLKLHYTSYIGFTQVTTAEFDLLMAWAAFSGLDINGHLPPHPAPVTTQGAPVLWL